MLLSISHLPPPSPSLFSFPILILIPHFSFTDVFTERGICLQLLVLKRAIADIRQTLQEMVCLSLFFHDVGEDKARIRHDLDEEVSELREECEEGRVERVAHYEEQLAEWKTYRRARVGTDL